MKLQELFDKSYDYELYDDNKYESAYRFVISDTVQIVVTVSADYYNIVNDKYWVGELTFTRADENGKMIMSPDDEFNAHHLFNDMKTGDVIKLLTTVVIIAKDAISRKNLDLLIFCAKNSEQSRVKTYRSLVKRINAPSKFEFNDPDNRIYSEPVTIWAIATHDEDYATKLVKDQVGDDATIKSV